MASKIPALYFSGYRQVATAAGIADGSVDIITSEEDYMHLINTFLDQSVSGNETYERIKDYYEF